MWRTGHWLRASAQPLRMLSTSGPRGRLCHVGRTEGRRALGQSRSVSDLPGDLIVGSPRVMVFRRSIHCAISSLGWSDQLRNQHLRRLSPGRRLRGANSQRLRREFVAGLASAAAWPLAARAQQGERVRRIGVLMPAAADDPGFQARIGAFLQGPPAGAKDRRRRGEKDRRRRGEHGAGMAQVIPPPLCSRGARE